MSGGTPGIVGIAVVAAVEDTRAALRPGLFDVSALAHGQRHIVSGAEGAAGEGQSGAGLAFVGGGAEAGHRSFPPETEKPARGGL
jgi:hypothetical protein